jgi:hypothetical protein
MVVFAPRPVDSPVIFHAGRQKTRGPTMGAARFVEAGVGSYAKISSSVGTFLFVMTLPIRETFMRCL